MVTCFRFALPAEMLLQSERKIEPDLRLAQNILNSCGVYNIWFPSNQIPVQFYLTLDLRDKVWLVYRAI